ncbi:hypothetical protein D1B33_04975 [Lysinibacillus yapensis]|uniref:Uncharacterized protein n=1 Tax=Ureibacillus yapensis TaxID=2304605 RepID=A0A396SA84_9BACL|nr:hypothetical protein [Lysinibacillus yapensis]RHW38241.1 hypothetical protein D1B33_04975 [Lysinibacillus yapensis]
MKQRFLRIFLIAALMVAIGFGYYFCLAAFGGDGKKTPEEALPTDAKYEWIEGPKSEKEQRYFFLSNGNYFGTGSVTKNLKGWTSGKGAYSPLPDPLEDDKITSAYSDGEILFGLIKPNGGVSVTVNSEKAELLPLSSLSEEQIANYQVENYEIWYIDLSKLKDAELYIIKVLDKNNSSLSELSI